jgi:hypothetical protein
MRADAQRRRGRLACRARARKLCRDDRADTSVANRLGQVARPRLARTIQWRIIRWTGGLLRMSHQNHRRCRRRGLCARRYGRNRQGADRQQ